MKTNSKASSKDTSVRVAGGFGAYAAKQNSEDLLRRCVMACLLGDDLHYESGETVKEQIQKLVPLVSPKVVRDMAVEARNKQNLRHVPLFLAREMLKYDSHKGYVGSLLPQIIQRADELAEFLAMYWREKKGTPLAKQAKIGLKNSFSKFNEYQFAKYDRNNEVKLRDVMFMVHPKPQNKEQEVLFKKIADRTLEVPNTWEVRYSACKSDDEKRAVWIDLIESNQLGALAYLRNLRNMQNVKVPLETIKMGLAKINPSRLVPLNILAAQRYAPRLTGELEDLFFRSFAEVEKLPGYTLFVVDISGSMGATISYKSELSRMDVATSLAIVARELCEKLSIYATAGDDWKQIHATKLVPPYRGFALGDTIRSMNRELGGGGIFTRQCLEYMKEQESEVPDRIIIFSDSQDCDHRNSTPKPFGKNNYIVDVSAHTRGINYSGVWTAEISGWSEAFLDYIMISEGASLQERE